MTKQKIHLFSECIICVKAQQLTSESGPETVETVDSGGCHSGGCVLATCEVQFKFKW